MIVDGQAGIQACGASEAHWSLSTTRSLRPQLLARLADHDAPLSSLPTDFLAILLHQSLFTAVASPDGYGGRRQVDVVRSRPA